MTTGKFGSYCANCQGKVDLSLVLYPVMPQRAEWVSPWDLVGASGDHYDLETGINKGHKRLHIVWWQLNHHGRIGSIVYGVVAGVPGVCYIHMRLGKFPLTHVREWGSGSYTLGTWVWARRTALQFVTERLGTPWAYYWDEIPEEAQIAVLPTSGLLVRVLQW